MDPDRARERLAKERARIEQEIEVLRQRADPDDTEDIADQGVELQQDETDFGLKQDLERVLAEIAEAEKRLDDGSYGKSVVSGKPIPDGRLEAIPWADRLVDEEPGGR
jgi:RNA polymerase-binding transcription factor